MAQGISSPHDFAVALLIRLGIRPNPQNVRAMVGWSQAEGGNWHNSARYNPLNTTQPMPGAGNTGSQGNIKVYTSWDQGIDATVRTLRNGRYNGILHALKNGNAGDVARAIGASPWGTSSSLIQQTIGGTPAQHNLSGGGGTVSRGSMPRAGSSTTTTYPGVDHGPDRRALIAQFVQQGGADNPAAVQALAMNLPGVLKDTPSRSVTKTSAPVSAKSYAGKFSSVPPSGGLVSPKAAWNPRGKSMAGWLAQALQWAHDHGWSGYVISGYRTAAEQQSAAQSYGLGHYPHGVQASNHRTGNAVDVADPSQLAQILKRYPGKRPIWGGPVMGDTPHFSNNGH